MSNNLLDQYNLTNNIVVTHQLKLSLTADQWELYSGEGYENRDVEASKLNACIAHAINNSQTKQLASQRCHKYLTYWAYYGANDSEGWQMLDIILDSVYGDELGDEVKLERNTNEN